METSLIFVNDALWGRWKIQVRLCDSSLAVTNGRVYSENVCTPVALSPLFDPSTFIENALCFQD